MINLVHQNLQFILFADDIKLLMSSNNLEDLQQKLIFELAGLSCWFKANKLPLNLDKTSYIVIKWIDNCKFLGVYLDKNLSWSVHIDKISNKISKTIGVTPGIWYKFDSTTPLMLYVIEIATPELVFTATTDTAQWVQIYGLLRPTDDNDDEISTV